MATKESHPLFPIGAKVFHGDGSTSVIAKVYKTGAFVLEGGTQQYRAFPRSSCASPTGTQGFFRGDYNVYAATPENIEMFRQRKENFNNKVAIRAEVSRLQAILNDRDEGVIEAAAKAIASRA
jgi:predicted sugar kinase